MRARVVEIVDGVLDGHDGEIDVMEDLAVPVSVAVSGDVVGIDAEDRPELRDLVTASVAALEGGATGETRVRAAEADAAIEEYFARLIERRRSDPKGDLLSHMVRLADTTDQLTADELMGNAIFFFPRDFRPQAD